MNKLVSALLDQSASGKTRKACGEYDVFTPEEKARIAKCAVEIGVTCAIRRLSKQFTDRSLKESSVRTWTKQYIKELERNKMSGMPHKTPTKLETKKRGCPLLLGEELDGQVKMYITALRSNSAVINSAIVMACAEGLVKSHDSNLLQSNGGHIVFTKFWAQSLLLRMGFVKRRATTKAKVSVTNFDKIKAQFLFDIKTIMEMEDIPKDLVINWDHTGKLRDCCNLESMFAYRHDNKIPQQFSRPLLEYLHVAHVRTRFMGVAYRYLPICEKVFCEIS